LDENNTDLYTTELSIVIPLYNEEESLEELLHNTKAALDNTYNYEIIFVDDGSKDESWNVIQKLSSQYENVYGFRLNRNYGKSTALQTGFERTHGKWIITMDADLQDDPREIPGMVEKLQEGCDLVSGWKKKRHDPINKTIPSKFFNFVTRVVTGIKLHDFNCGLKAYKREVIEQISLYGEMHRYVPLLADWEGYKAIGEQVVQHHPRKYGETKFGVTRFLKGFLDLLTIVIVNQYLQRPMHFFGSLGLFFSLIGFVISGYLTYLKIAYDEPLSDRPLLLLGILLIVLGVQFFSTGILGEMINKNNSHRKKPNIRETAGLKRQ